MVFDIKLYSKRFHKSILDYLIFLLFENSVLYRNKPVITRECSARKAYIRNKVTHLIKNRHRGRCTEIMNQSKMRRHRCLKEVRR